MGGAAGTAKACKLLVALSAAWGLWSVFRDCGRRHNIRIYILRSIYIYIYASLAHVGAFSNAASRSVRGQRKSAWAFQMTFPSVLYFGVFFLSPQYTICEKDDEGGDDEDEMRVGGSVGGGGGREHGNVARRLLLRKVLP